ncbi:hypothetical protein SDJN02_05924, partial [Cucurbita argyrosperma subsp. argyrosperma]
MPAKTRRNFALFLAIASAIRGNEEQDKGFEVMPPSFHDISDVEFQDNWGRIFSHPISHLWRTSYERLGRRDGKPREWYKYFKIFLL